MADVVSTGEAFSSTDAQREIWPVVAEVAVGTALINAGSKPGVAYTNSGGHTGSQVIGDTTLSGFPDGGVGLDALKCSVAVDGTYEFAVTGASSSTPNGTLVYAVVSGGRITSLTLTSTSNTLFGEINNPADYVGAASAICVKIGTV